MSREERDTFDFKTLRLRWEMREWAEEGKALGVDLTTGFSGGAKGWASLPDELSPEEFGPCLSESNSGHLMYRGVVVPNGRAGGAFTIASYAAEDLVTMAVYFGRPVIKRDKHHFTRLTNAIAAIGPELRFNTLRSHGTCLLTPVKVSPDLRWIVRKP